MVSAFDKASIPILSNRQRLLTRSEFQRLAEVPPEVEWFANLTNQNSRRAYRNDVSSFVCVVGVRNVDDSRTARHACSPKSPCPKLVRSP